jgi:translation elongation factor aEF-1 beta
MGEVIGLIRVMPAEVIEDEKINKMIEDIKKVVKAPAKLGKIEVKNVAFGLKGLNVTVAVPDTEGGLDPVVESIKTVENVDSAEVTDVGRM